MSACAVQLACMDEPGTDLTTCTEGCGTKPGQHRTASEACRYVFGEVLACVAQLDCEDYEMWFAQRPRAPIDYPCEAQDVQVELECGARR